LKSPKNIFFDVHLKMWEGNPFLHSNPKFILQIHKKCHFFQNGDTPLHIASAMGRRKLVRILMETGREDLTVKNQQQETPIGIAERKQYTEISAIFQNPPKVRAEYQDLNQDDSQSVSRESRREKVDKSFENEGKSNNNTSKSHKKYRKVKNKNSYVFT